MKFALKRIPPIQVIGWSALLAASLVSARLFASDRGDEPVAADAPADIVDVFSFMAPNPKPGFPGEFLPSNRLVLAMTVLPNASANDVFASDVDYTFRVQSTADLAAPDGAVDVLVSCRFAAPIAGQQEFVCSSNGFFYRGNTGEVSNDNTAALRVFAGHRRDPSSGPASALLGLQNGPAAAPIPNPYATQSVLAVIAELDVTQVVFGGVAPAEMPLLSVSAETSR